jgi:hypothetical protein
MGGKKIAIERAVIARKRVWYIGYDYVITTAIDLFDGEMSR